MINEPKPIPEPSKTPQEVKIVSGDSTKVFKIGSALPALEKEKMVSFLRANMFSLGNTRIWLELIGRSYNIVSTSTQDANLYSRSGEYLHQSATKQ